MDQKEKVVRVEIDAPAEVAANVISRAAAHGISTSEFWVNAALYCLGGVVGMLEAGRSGPECDEEREL